MNTALDAFLRIDSLRDWLFNPIPARYKISSLNSTDIAAALRESIHSHPTGHDP